MVLTRIAWVTVVTSASKVSYDHQFRRGIVGSRFLYNIDIKILKYEEITSFYWDVYDKEWKFNETGEVELKDNQLIDGTMKVTITKLSDTNMTTYQKDEDGETYITYTKLLY